MGRVSFGALALATLLLVAGVNGHHMGRESEEEFVATEMEEYIRNEAGRVEVVSEKFKMLREADFTVGVVTIEPNSLALPHYCNTPTLRYIISGRACANLVSPIGMPSNVKELEKGDVYAVPKGWMSWIWNDGKEPLRFVIVARRSHHEGSNVPRSFQLMGGKEMRAGALIHGFSKDVLARAWDVEEDDVRELLESQKETVFMKVPEGAASKISWQQSTSLLGQFMKNVRRSDPEVMVRNGGVINHINSLKLPWLKHMDISMAWGKLEGGALLAPHYTNGWRLFHIINGKARMEMARPDGRNALRTDISAGNHIVVPAFWPMTMCADDNEGLEYVSFSNTDMPIPTFLAGYNSLYHALPKEVLRQGLNLKEELLEKVYRTRRRREEVEIFPRKEEGVQVPHFEGGNPTLEAFEAYMQELELKIVK